MVGSSWKRPCVETERSDNQDFSTFLTLKSAFSNGENDKKDAFSDTRGHPWAPVGTRGHPRTLGVALSWWKLWDTKIAFKKDETRGYGVGGPKTVNPYHEGILRFKKNVKNGIPSS